MNIITLTLNPVLDITINIDTLSFDKPNMITAERVDPAGKGLNVSRILTAFSVPNCCIMLLGEKHQDDFVSLLKTDGVVCDIVSCQGKIRENYSIVVKGQDGLLKIDRRGEPCTEERFEEVILRVLSHLKKEEQNILVLSGSFPPGISFAHIQRLIAACKEYPLMVTVDSRSVTYKEIISLSPYIIKPNIHELRDMTGLDLVTNEEIIAASRNLLSQGVQNVLVSMGKDGIIFVNPSHRLHIRVPKVDVLCDVGAGDSTLTGFLISKFKGFDDIKCAKLAASFGTASVMVAGTNPPKQDQIDWVYDHLLVNSY